MENYHGKFNKIQSNVTFHLCHMHLPHTKFSLTLNNTIKSNPKLNHSPLLFFIFKSNQNQTPFLPSFHSSQQKKERKDHKSTPSISFLLYSFFPFSLLIQSNGQPPSTTFEWNHQQKEHSTVNPSDSLVCLIASKRERKMRFAKSQVWQPCKKKRL